MLRLRLLVGAGVLLFAGTAHAGCSTATTVVAKDGATPPATIVLTGTQDSTGNCVFPNIIQDGGGAANRAAVKAASTAPTAADPALVVAVSPNSGGFGCVGQSVANTISTPISITANTRIITGVAAKQTYICSINLVVSAPDNVALVEGTLTTTPCDTGTAGMAGGTTAGTGWNLAANGGLTLGSGVGLVARTATAANNVCLLVSSGAQVSGTIVWAQF